MVAETAVANFVQCLTQMVRSEQMTEEESSEQKRFCEAIKNFPQDPGGTCNEEMTPYFKQVA